MSNHAWLSVVVIRAVHLPKTDLLGSIDAYVKIKIAGQTAKTKTKDSDKNPVWDEKFGFEVQLTSSGTPFGTPVSFEIWDKDTFSDDHVGSAELSVQPDNTGPGGRPLELPIRFFSDKHKGRASYLTVQLAWIFAPATLARLSNNPNALVNLPERRVYLPLPPQFGPVVLGLEYEKAAIDVKLFVTQPQTGIFLDLLLIPPPPCKTEVRRRLTREPVHIFGPLYAFEELKVNDIPLSTDFAQLKVVKSQKQVLETVNLDTVVSRHGWRGAMSWETAARALQGVELDRKEQEIYMPMGNPPESFVVVDFDKGDVDMKCIIIDIPVNQNQTFDLTFEGKDVKKKSSFYQPPKVAMEGRLAYTRKLELDDVPYGTSFKKMQWSKYALANTMLSSLTDLVKLR